ncbi:MAG: hypothetical protein KBA03_05320 [Anaerolineaceae bacterium]|nr:hypothetical protein [Anaerolineaceae bacterium]
MSDPSDELRICPHCGQQNSVFTLVCINCGQELDDIFEIEGVEDSSTENLHEQALEDVLKSLDKNPLLSPEEENAEDSETETKEPSDGEAPLPSWLDRIRQRAKEEDPAGDLAKASRAADEKRGEVDETFEQFLQRVRESEQKNAGRPRKHESGLVDENGTPEWLRRMRELHSNQEESLEDSSTASDDDWTDEELEELFRKELGLPKPDKKPEEAPVENLESLEKPKQAEEEIVPDDFHNILDEDIPSPSTLATNEEDETSEALQETDSDQKDLDNSEGLAKSDETEDDEKPAEAVEHHVTDDFELEGALAEASPLADDEESEASDLPEIEEAETPDYEEEIDESPQPTEDLAPDLILLRDQRDRARILNEIISQEGRRSIPLLHENKNNHRLGSIILSLILILGILATILFMPNGSPALPNSPTAIAFAENLETISKGQSVLIVLDYQAGSRNEIEPLLEKLLESLESKNISLRVVTANPENLWLSAKLFAGSPQEIEFIPGSVLGYLSMAVAEKPEWGALPMDKAVKTNPDIFTGLSHLILVSDSSEFVRSWMEQVSPFQLRLNTSVITTSVSAPMLSPYFASGQIKGYVAGLSDAKTLGVEKDLLVNQRAFQVGTLLMILVLLLGIIMKLDEDSQSKAERSTE